ncbi:MAG: hypothetical protein HYT10_01730 [Candidatus Levybacteria bacterium]|nr:hypothetical protein [Candidatus Levybacteria bacterium]
MRYRISPQQTIRGHAFPEYIHNEKKSRRRFDSMSDNRSFRSFLMPVCFLLVFLLLFSRLVFLSVFQGNYYQRISDNNRIRTFVIHAPRGVVFDRNGKPLVLNTPGFRRTEKGKTVLLDREQALSLIASGVKDLEVDNLRHYPYKEVFAHVLGYIGQITKEELSSVSYTDYQAGDLVGKEGIEKQYEATLRGIDGKQLSEVDALGKTVRTLGQTDPIAGQNIKTTLDSTIQIKTFEAMAKVKKGAAIVSTPKGEILAIVSKPSFDPNLFTLGKGYKVATTSGYQTLDEVLLDTESQPLLNRAIGGTYPPGSTFKLVTAAAGLEKNVIDENWEIQDNGQLKVGAFTFGNWYYIQYGKTEGSVNIVKAIKRSNDIFFYTLSQKIGVDQLSQVARQFGLGQKLGIDIPGEQRGLVPTQEWKEKTIGEGWYLGDTYHYGIGQGYLLTTPLQVNAWTVALANGGILFRPRLVVTADDAVLTKIPLSDKTISLIHEGMKESCSTGGVAWPLFKFKVKNEKLKIDGRNFLAVAESTTSASMKNYREITVACKTGTAQHGGESDLPHAWITLYAPAYDPEIIVTVLNESSGEGSNEAAPIAKKVLEAWFSR